MITRAAIEASRAKLAQIMVTHDLPQLGPILERLNRELEARTAQDAAMAMARKMVEANQSAAPR
ncbi:MAG: hypothetical protein COB08_016995 [Rhodobacteraceae bacterium]|nr:hypothetical protein [Paracoccaceae bacterium]